MADLSVSFLFRVALASAVLIGFAPVMATAQSFSAAPRAISVVHIPGAAQPFDWLSKKRASRTGTVADAVLVSSNDAPLIRQSRFFGHGSYICTPAGFGKKARCFAR